MQGTMVVLMALSGLGCHHKHCDVVHAPASYSSCYDGGWGGCHGVSYVSGCYSAPVVIESGYSACYDSCYSGGWGGCYSSCYGGKRHGGLLGRLFGHKNRGCHGVVYSACYDAGYSACYSSGYAAGYSALLFWQR